MWLLGLPGAVVAVVTTKVVTPTKVTVECNGLEVFMAQQTKEIAKMTGQVLNLQLV